MKELIEVLKTLCGSFCIAWIAGLIVIGFEYYKGVKDERENKK